MGLHVRALEARVQSAAVDRSELRVERAGHEDDQHREEGRDDAEDGHDPDHELAPGFPGLTWWGILLAATYTTDLGIVASSGYPSPATDHTWSLSGEEQFYFVLPIAMVVALGRRWRMTTFATVAVVGSLVGGSVVALLAALFTVLGLNLAGLFEFGNVLPGRLAGWKAKNPTVNAFLSGVLATAIASPCTAPFMGASLGYAVSLPALQALSVFAAIGVGMALPYLAASAIPAVARALLRTSRYLNGAHHDQLAAMRNERDARRLRETLNALRATGGNVSQAAEILKMSRSGLNYRLKQLGLR